VSASRRSVLFWLGIPFVLIVLLALAPLLSALIAGAIAGALGCGLNEGGASPCPFMGHDLGEPLVVMFVLGWLAFVTLPLGAAALAAWLVVVCVVVLVRWRRRRRVEA
jgi:hypothetical protein